LRLVRGVVNRKLGVHRTIFVLASIPGVEDEKELAQGTEGGLVEEVFLRE
jgi:hypothetical protein